MKIRSLAASFVVAAAAMLPLAGVASAQPDRDCPDFASQAEAQAALDAAPGDPERLDADNDGIACESEFGEPTASPTPAPAEETTSPAPTPAEETTSPAPAPAEDTAGTDEDADEDDQITEVPQGGVETGDGTGAGVDPAVLALGGFAALGVAAFATRRAATGRR
ncbi:excalibur calcium-binding domain-containing protein [Pseudonocardia nigra]|uniref:excalibur calcium-binding domain-containing protein n=1 Tax=Pseudonocardia nigra TaxID=1921578 RepID=UPI0027E32DA1|nr:excalibur calcium-binding domain-containing protein [Pseudonocardia nigra]